MKSLQDLLYRLPLIEVIGTTDRVVSGLAFDSRKVREDGLFVAVPGTTNDGHDFMGQAVHDHGATAIVCERLPEVLDKRVTYIRVQDAQKAISLLAANWYDNPAEELTIVGTTGTNGKTTVSTLLYQLFTQLAGPCGLISTVCVRIGETIESAALTTPDPLTLHGAFRRMVDEGCRYAFMEVSSHAMHQKRTNGIHFSGGIFTNLTHDHLDYHKTFENYLKAKQSFFDKLPSRAFALTNIDDRNGQVMTQNTQAKVRTYSLERPADYKGKMLEQHLTGQLLNINDKSVWFKLTGHFNSYNLLAVCGAALELGAEAEDVLLAASLLEAPAGRLQTVELNDDLIAVVDYAHTPDALKNVLVTLNEIRAGRGHLWTIVGCGGNRDKTKRPIMAALAVEHSDKVILTSDNPRNEDPQVILDEMWAGVPVSKRRHVARFVDRREAIETAICAANPGDVILIAGKGHETYQEIKGIRHPFDDREEAIRASERRHN